MTAKEKAKELVNQFYDITLNVESDDDINKYTAKQCALIAVDEMIKEVEHWQPRVNYLNEVKQEINQL
jgi:hypothetical protein